MPDQNFLEKIKNKHSVDTEVTVISNQSEKEKIAHVVSEASVKEMDDKKFRIELSKYLKPNTTQSPIGMPCIGFGMPTPISFLAPLLIKFVNVNKLSQKKDEELLKNHTPVFVIISTRDDNPKSWIIAGQLFERIAVEAEEKNIKNHPLVSPIEEEEFYKHLQNIIQTSFRPQFFFRLGFSDIKAPHSPRLTVNKL